MNEFGQHVSPLAIMGCKPHVGLGIHSHASICYASVWLNLHGVRYLIPYSNEMYEI